LLWIKLIRRRIKSQKDKRPPDSCRIALIAAAFLACACAVGLAEPLPVDKGADQDRPWRITADQLIYKKPEKTYIARGNVVIKKAATELSADFVRLNEAAMEAVATGNVILLTREGRLTGRQMRMDLDSQTGTVYDGLIFIERKNFYIRGDTIKKTGKSRYTINRGSLTSCDGEVPDWRVTGRDLAVRIGGYGSVHHAALWAKKMPVAYLPYFIFPVERNRQSGFLTPEIGYSDRNGVEYVQPFFWAINRSCDATFYYHHIQNRGEKFGGEFRYLLSNRSKATMMLDSMSDRKVDDGTHPESPWGYTDDDYLRPNSDRYWFRMKANQALPYGMDAQLDLDIVSDQDYLREFEDGYTGYDRSYEYFESEFGRSLDDSDDPVRENRLNIKKIWTLYSLNADLLWYDNVIKRRRSGTDRTLQELPVITFDALKQPLFDTPLFFRSNDEYVYFHREDGITGHRMDIHPIVSLPLRADRFFVFEPSLGVRQTLWIEDDSDIETEATDREDGYQHRELYDVGAVLSTDLYRVYHSKRPAVDAVKHTIIPEIRYEYVPGTDQSEYPDFDGIDRIEGENRLTLSLTQFLNAKYRVEDAASRAADGAKNHKSTRYNRFFRFLIEQSYDFNKEGKADAEPFTPLYAEMDITPLNLLNLHAEAEWSHKEDALVSNLISGRLRNQRGDHVALEYRYVKDTRQSIDLLASVAVTDRLRISGKFERNLDSGGDIEKGLECLYQSQCWSVAVGFSDDGTDQRLSCAIRLHGLGEIGNRL